MNNVPFNAQTAFLHKQWHQQLFTHDLENGAITMMPRPPGGIQLKPFVEYLRDHQGVDVVVSLLQFEEAKSLSLVNEGSVCEQCGIEFVNFPIKDHRVPAFFVPFNQLITKLVGDVQQGKKLAIHCYAGIGRTGLVAASILVKLGMEVDYALLNLSQSRGLRVPETLDQISWLHHHNQALNSTGVNT